MTTKPSNTGSALLAVIFLITIVSLSLAIAFTTTSAQARFMKRSVDRATALAYGDGILESVYDQWRIAITDSKNLDGTQRTSGLSTNELMTGTPTSPSIKVPPTLPLALPASTVLAPPPGITLAAWSVKAADPYLNPLASATARPLPESGTSSRLRVRQYYVAVAVVAFPGGSATVRRVFTRAGRNLFDNFLYSTRRVTEIHPGAPMYVDGTIYAGGDLYMAQNTLHLEQDVSYTGEKYLNYKGGATETGEASTYWDSRYGTQTPSISSSAWPANAPPHKGSEQKLLDAAASELDPNFLDGYNSNNTDSDSNPNNEGYYELLKEVSDPAKADPLKLDTDGTSQRLAVNADYRIYVDAANNVTVFKGNSTTALPSTDAQAVAIKGAITTNNSIKDVREGDNVRLVNLNVDSITTAAAAGTISDVSGNSDGLLLYVKDTSFGTSVTTKGYVKSGSSAVLSNVTSTKARGVRLTNGGKLPPGGLSIASPNAVYIQGDYNTGTVGTTKPPSNNSGAYGGTTDPSPVVSGYTRAASVVVGDSVNVLSNNWSDSKAILGQAVGDAPAATPTTINTAIVAGNVPTTKTSYSGGVENFPRFHENWGGVTITLHGSFGMLFDSTQAKGLWTSALYGAPDRRWFFDTTLQSKNPPGFPVAYSYDRGRRTTY
jgi:hypothetical protein